MAYIPPAALVGPAQVLVNGAKKYGRANWREHAILRTEYLAATLRHVFADLDGEDNDQEDGETHLDHAIATLLILRDAMLRDKCDDDRPKVSGAFAGTCRAKYGEPTAAIDPAAALVRFRRYQPLNERGAVWD